ncbi:MAG: metallophosphoesterase [Chitinophagaceae bacterium]
MIRLIFLFSFLAWATATQSQEINIAFISDVHYGIKRAHFRGEDFVDAQTVNKAMVNAIKALPVQHLDYIILTGDIANREEMGIQSATESWNQFSRDYIRGLPIPFFLLPGNHDVSNAIGFYKPMEPKTDASSMAGIYNSVFHPKIPKTKQTYHYKTDKINYSKNIGGVHLMFVNIWPDSANLVWMEMDMKKVTATTPVLIFAHDPPESDPKHFSGNTNGSTECHFENLLDEQYKDGDCKTTVTEQRRLCDFLSRHNNVKAYFHGHSNYTEFSTYKGIDGSLSLPVFRVDSPMKGKFSSVDESLLAFDIITINPKTRQLRVREYLWNKNPAVWGQETTISLK